MYMIHEYSRKTAIEDGSLIDVTEVAAEAGFKVNTVITLEVYNILNDIPEEHSHQSYKGRLWDLLFVGYVEACKYKESDQFTYKFICHHNKLKSIEEMVHISCRIHGGDNFEPVITFNLEGGC